MFHSLVTLVFFQLYLLTMSSTHRFSTVSVNHVFFTNSKQTNRHLGARLSQIEKAANLKHQEIWQMVRVEFTLAKLQKSVQKEGV